VISHGAVGLTIRLLALEGFTFVVEFLATADADLELGEAPLKIDLGRHQGQPFFINLLDQFVDFRAMQKQLALPQRVVVFAIALFVRADVHIVNEHLAVADATIGFLDTHLPHAHSFHLCALQSQSSLEDFVDEIFVISLFIVGNYFYAHEIHEVG